MVTSRVAPSGTSAAGNCTSSSTQVGRSVTRSIPNSRVSPSTSRGEETIGRSARASGHQPSATESASAPKNGAAIAAGSIDLVSRAMAAPPQPTKKQIQNRWVR